MASLRALVVCVLTVSACDQPETKPTAPAQPEQPAAREFRFAPTLAAYKPAGSAMELIAEVGDAATGTMTLVVAQHDGSALTVATWRFASTGADDTLEPAAPPTPLLAVLPGESSDRETLDALNRTRAAAHTVKRRPQGVSAVDAEQALRKLDSAARSTLQTGDGAEERTRALARFARGLDDDLLFSNSGLSTALAVATSTSPSTATAVSERRASFTRGEHRISMLKKGDGWVIDAVK